MIVSPSHGNRSACYHGGAFPSFLYFVGFLLVVFLKNFGLYCDSSMDRPHALMYEETWESLDSRPLPEWYDKAKVGIFIHWGVFSVPSFDTGAAEWFWYSWRTGGNKVDADFVKRNYPPQWKYPDFASSFRAELFNPKEWVDLFADAGAKYVVLTSKHHDGFCLWPNPLSWNWNSMDIGPHRDLVGELAAEVRRHPSAMRFGLYHSLYEWFNPLYLEDKMNKFSTQKFVDAKPFPELMQLVNEYAPDVVWSDGDWEANDDYWKSRKFLAWLYNESPVRDSVVTNDFWGRNALCRHGGFLTCSDRFNPNTRMPRKWENCFTLDEQSWGYRRNARLENYMTPKTMIRELISTVSNGGNVLINVGPTADGSITPIYEERLRQLGDWLKVNGEAIYETKMCHTSEDKHISQEVWYTCKRVGRENSDVFAMFTTWPETNQLILSSVPTDVSLSRSFEVTMLGVGARLDTEVKKVGNSSELVIHLPHLLPQQLPSQYAWALKIRNKPVEMVA